MVGHKIQKTLTRWLLNLVLYINRCETRTAEELPETKAKVVSRQVVAVQVKRLSEAAVIPTYAHESDAGFDLYATEDVDIPAGKTVTVPTGLAFGLPDSHEIQLRPRSGMSLKTKFRIPNSPATIDAGFRGELMVIAENTGNAVLHVKKGDRIAQGVLNEVPRARFMVIDDLPESDRGEKGFGSTGVNDNE